MAPLENPGLWGEPTSTIDWCENNYEISFYVAEFWNTVSNLAMILPPAVATYFTWKDSLGIRFALCHISLLFVGIGSWAFHMTLLYEMQLFDELPMLWGSCVIIFSLVGVLLPELGRQRLIAIGLFSYAFVVTVVYLTIKKPIFHEVAYGVLVTVIFLMDIHLARTFRCDIRLFLVAAMMYLLGFLLWNVDNVYCSRLTSLRLDLPIAVSPVTQLHAWWHLFAGYATYLHITFCTHAFAINKKFKCKITLNPFMGLCLKAKARRRLEKRQH